METKRRASTLLRLTGFALAVAASGCVRSHPNSIDRVEARYNRLSSDPVVARNASGSLDEARQRIDQANREWRSDHDAIEADHFAYLADRNLDIAEQQARLILAESERENVVDRHARVGIIEREREIGRARLRAEQSELDAERYKAQALANARALEGLRRELVVLRSVETERGLELTLADVLFDLDRSEINPGSQRKLDPLVRYLEEQPAKRVLVEGYADSTGSSAYNQRLSQARADAVRDYLIERGISPSRVTARGYGESYPLAANVSDAGRLQNRRVQVVIQE